MKDENGVFSRVGSRKYWVIGAIVCALLAAAAVVFLRGAAAPEMRKLTMEDVKTLAQKGDGLKWSDFDGFESEETGSGMYIRSYDIDSEYFLRIGGTDEKKAQYFQLQSKADPQAGMDIREGDVDAFLKEQASLAAQPDRAEAFVLELTNDMDSEVYSVTATWKWNGEVLFSRTASAGMEPLAAGEKVMFFLLPEDFPEDSWSRDLRDVAFDLTLQDADGREIPVCHDVIVECAFGQSQGYSLQGSEETGFLLRLQNQ